MKLKEFPYKIIFSHKGFLDQKVCGIEDLKANKGKASSTKNFFKFFFKIEEKCAFLDKSIPSRGAMIHSILFHSI